MKTYEEKWLADGKYMSHNIVNEIIGLAGNKCLRKTCEVKTASVFSLIADGTSDESRTEQLVLCVRWVDRQFPIHEEPVGLYAMNFTDAESIEKGVLDVLIRLQLDIKSCHGQGIKWGIKYEW
ncbi:hypothetical protein PR048_018147 [Dryococelus australis]|uniref:DUF4371 domain-containing protein n=1 Tax=Dryococelus australis TaxID=614101 RepID=A0ABQ9HBT6_9NEOP|nr:hypothetical protein PR048_018147 [Dryococelus australis]